MKRTSSAFLLLALAALILFSSAPASGTSLSRAVAAAGRSGPEWLAYHVPLVATREFMCCFSREFRLDTCRLEGKEYGWGSTDERTDPTAELSVLLRVEKGRVGRVRAVSGSCGIDATPLKLTWLEGVSGEESVAFLAGLLQGADSEEDEIDRLLATLALHQDGVPELVAIMRRTRSAEVRRQTLFWLGQSEDPRALAELERILAR